MVVLSIEGGSGFDLATQWNITGQHSALGAPIRWKAAITCCLWTRTGPRDRFIAATRVPGGREPSSGRGGGD